MDVVLCLCARKRNARRVCFVGFGVWLPVLSREREKKKRGGGERMALVPTNTGGSRLVVLESLKRWCTEEGDDEGPALCREREGGRAEKEKKHDGDKNGFLTFEKGWKGDGGS